jgi:hypothetical protein
MDSASPSGLDQKLTSSLNDIVDKHKSTIMPVLLGQSSGLTLSLLRNDDAVRKVAEVCYELLPGLVRLAVKQPTFVSFVLNNREKILGRLIDQAAGPTPA